MNLPTLPKTESYAQAQKWRSIKGKIAEALSDRLERMKVAVDELDKHIEQCKDCQTSEDAYRLCPTGNRLCHAALNV